MKGTLLRLGLALAACSVWAVTLDAQQSMHPSPPTAPPPSQTRSAGAQIYDKWCSDCHSTPSGPGSLALQRKYQGNLPAVLEQRSDLSADYIKAAVRNGVSFMPSFRKTEISDPELALLAAYLENAHGSQRK